uniref:Uncharacterized protein n=1 Tax=Trichuris muris TaxID=70415 RepID=A0A5S6R057_TRIMR
MLLGIIEYKWQVSTHGQQGVVGVEGFTGPVGSLRGIDLRSVPGGHKACIGCTSRKCGIIDERCRRWKAFGQSKHPAAVAWSIEATFSISRQQSSLSSTETE